MGSERSNLNFATQANRSLPLTIFWHCKDTNKRTNYKINFDLILVSSGSIFEIYFKDRHFFLIFQIFEQRKQRKVHKFHIFFINSWRFTNLFCTFAIASAPCGWDIYWGVLSRWAEHYILEGVTDALFLDFRNYHNRIENKDIAGVTPRGVAYTLRSVLRGLTMFSLAHFTVYSILPRGCFSVCYSLWLW